LQQKSLVRSHLAPSALYDLCRSQELDPVVVTAEVVMNSGRELKHPLLCKECDGALSRDGEDWTLPLLATIDGKFPFYDILTRVPPDLDESDLKGYAASRNPDIDVEKLTHFGLGVLWKASVHSWSGRRTEPQIELGPYREEIRKFLRSEGPFPRYVALTVGISPPPVKDIAFNQPYLGSKSTCHYFMFYVPGIAFALSVGKGIGDAKENCFYSNPLHPIVVGDISSGIKSVFRRISAGAHKSQKLVKYLQERSGRR
jgi:hypothetical protein